ncbi:MAG: S41 family peptidase [Planctomycetota bacterium]
MSGSAWGQVSPFTRVEFDADGTLVVTLDGERVPLVLLGGVPTAELIAGAKREFGDRWQKRIGEDLLEVFEALDVELDSEDAIDVVIFRDGEFVEIADAPMTRSNRMAVWEWNHTARIDHFDDLVAVIKARHAYASMRGVDVAGEAERLKRELGQAASRDDVLLAMRRLVCMLGDGHATIEDWDASFPAGRLPMLLIAVEGGVAAVENDRGALVDRQHPYVVSIDGVPLGSWVEAASAYVAAGSEQLVLERSLRLLRYVNFVRGELGLSQGATVELVLSDGTGGERVVERRVVERRGLYGQWPRTESGVLEGGVGYLRLPRMSAPDRERDESRWISLLREELARVTADASGLIIDVRGNGGGRRTPIGALMPCLMEPGAAPVVVNAARYRLEPGDDPGRRRGYLRDRSLYPEAWDGWTNAERASIAAFREGFTPAWEVPGEGFSDWHYMVVSPGGEGVPRFDGSVVVLMDENCFSATDIFLGAFAELPNVTLVGTPSAGGSARSVRHHAGAARVWLASMASYQPNGQLYDGNGVMPDVIVEKRPGDVVLGGGDAQLERALAIVTAQGR